MDNNSLLMIILAFVVGYCLPSMMKNMCGGRLVEGYGPGSSCDYNGGMGGQTDCNGWGVDRDDLTCNNCSGKGVCTEPGKVCADYS